MKTTTLTSKFVTVLASIGLGIIAPVAFIVGGSIFENQGDKERVAGLLALALFCAVCQFWLPRKGSGGFRANSPIMIGMVASLLAARFLGLCPNWEQFIYGCVGSLAGSLLATLRTAKVVPAARV